MNDGIYQVYIPRHYEKPRIESHYLHSRHPVENLTYGEKTLFCGEKEECEDYMENNFAYISYKTIKTNKEIEVV